MPAAPAASIAAQRFRPCRAADFEDDTDVSMPMPGKPPHRHLCGIRDAQDGLEEIRRKTVSRIPAISINNYLFTR